MTDAAQEAAAGLVDYVNQAAEAEAERAEREESEQPTETTELEEVEIEEEIPDEIRRLLEEPELDDEDEIDTTPVAEEYYEDEDVDALKRKLVKEQKRRVYLEDVQQKSALKQAKKDAQRYFPHADPDTIQATSRRGFLKQAREQHDRIKVAVDKAVASERDALTKAREEVQAQTRQERSDAWGQPVESGGVQRQSPPERKTTSNNPEVSFLESTRERLASGNIKL